MSALFKNLKRLDRLIGMALKIVSLSAFCVVFVLLIGNVIVRYYPFMSFHWFDEIVEWSFAWLVFFGAAALWRDNEHFRIYWLLEKLPLLPGGKLLRAALDLVSVLFFAVLTYQGYKWASRAMDWTAYFNLPRKIIYACVPISGGIMLIYSIKDVVQPFIKTAARSEPDPALPRKINC